MKRMILPPLLLLACALMPTANAGSASPALPAAVKTVYITQHGKRYHKKNCRTIKKRKATAVSEKAAREKGKTPCKVCKP